MAYHTLFVLTLALLSHSLAAPTAHISFKLPQTASRISFDNSVVPTLARHHFTDPPTTATNPTSSTPSTSTYPPTSTTQDVETTFCRQVQLPPSQCVDPPDYTDNQVDFCPYRLCAPKYVEAELCPADNNLGAKAKCYEEEITRDVYKCDNISKRTKTTCNADGSECKEVQYCSCIKIPDVSTKQLKFLTVFKPSC